MSRSEFKTPPVQRTSRGRVLLLAIAIPVVLVWVILAAKTQDPLWPLGGSYIPAPPSRIAIHDEGEMQTILPGDPEYDRLSDAILASVGELDSPRPIDVDLSEETLSDLLTQSTSMEVFFPQPLRYHAAVRIIPPDKLLIPLKGRHAGRAYMFLGNGEMPYRPGALCMQDDTPLREVLGEMGIDVEELRTGSANTGQP